MFLRGQANSVMCNQAHHITQLDRGRPEDRHPVRTDQRGQGQVSVKHISQENPRHQHAQTADQQYVGQLQHAMRVFKKVIHVVQPSLR